MTKTVSGAEAFRIANIVATRNIERTSEHKFHDVQDGGTAISNAGFMFTLTSGLAQGDLTTERDGASIFAEYLMLRYSVLAADSTQSFRVVVFRWLRTGAPTVSQVLQDISTVPTLSAINMVNSKYIDILHDNTMNLVLSGSTGFQTIKKFIQIKKSIDWQPGTTSNEKGNIYLLAISDSAAVSHPTIKLFNRTRYMDK